MGQGTFVYKAPKAEGKAKEALTIVYRTIQGTTDDWMQCCQARSTTGNKSTPSIQCGIIEKVPWIRPFARSDIGRR